MKNVFKSRLKDIVRFMTSRPSGGKKSKDFNLTYQSLGKALHDTIGKKAQ